MCDTVNLYGRYGDTAYGVPARRAEWQWTVEQAIRAANLSAYNRMVTLNILDDHGYAAAVHWVDTLRELEVSDGEAAED